MLTPLQQVIKRAGYAEAAHALNLRMTFPEVALKAWDRHMEDGTFLDTDGRFFKAPRQLRARPYVDKS